MIPGSWLYRNTLIATSGTESLVMSLWSVKIGEKIAEKVRKIHFTQRNRQHHNQSPCIKNVGMLHGLLLKTQTPTHATSA